MTCKTVERSVTLITEYKDIVRLVAYAAGAKVGLEQAYESHRTGL
jgi:hypothetical protein